MWGWGLKKKNSIYICICKIRKESEAEMGWVMWFTKLNFPIRTPSKDNSWYVCTYWWWFACMYANIHSYMIWLIDGMQATYLQMLKCASATSADASLGVVRISSTPHITTYSRMNECLFYNVQLVLYSSSKRTSEYSKLPRLPRQLPHSRLAEVSSYLHSIYGYNLFS